MTDKEAIKICKKIITEKFNLDYSIDNVDKEAIEILLNLIQKQEEEIEFQKDINKMEKKRYKQTKKSLKGQIIKANKIMDLMAETLRYYNGVGQEQEFCIDICGEKECNIKKCANRIKEHFERKVENGR